MNNVSDTRTALEILEDNAHLKAKYVVAKHTATAYAFFDVLAGGEAVFSLPEWHDRINPILASDETVGDWLNSHSLTVARWKEGHHAINAA